MRLEKFPLIFTFGVLILQNLNILKCVTGENLGMASDVLATGWAKVIGGDQKQFEMFFDKMIDGFAYHKIVVDKAGKPVDYVFLEVNHAFERMTGLRRERIIGKRATEVLAGIEKDPSDLIGVYGRVALTGQPVQFENHAKSLGKWFKIAAYCPGKGHFVALYEDITERKRQEREIESLSKFPSENPNPVFRIDENGTILYCNQAGASFLTGWICKTGERAPKHIGQLVADALASNKKVELEETFGAKTFLLSFAPVIVEGYVNIYATDITERKKGEAQILEQLHMLDLAHVIVKNMKDEIIFWNSGAQKLYGFSKGGSD